MAIRRPRRGRVLAVSLLFAAAATTAAATQAMTAAADTQAPATGEIKEAASATAVPGSYIVVMKDGAAVSKTKLAAGYGGAVRRSFGEALNGFEASMTEAGARRLAADPSVAYVEQNQRVSLLDTQTGATWGLDRIDQRNLPLNGTYAYPGTASNVTAYVIDTGIRTSHTDFGGRASSGYDAVDGGSADDCNGHGTHVAGTVGGDRYGVAKGVSLVAVRVLDCSGSGTTAGVIAGVNWVTGNRNGPSVANMSLGGRASTALDDAVAGSIGSGVTYALAAGNSRRNACTFSPARVGTAVTVGATTSTDARATYSNYGPCLDLFAPGSSITSAWHTGTAATNTISGTSLASPHVAGAAALVLSANPLLSPAEVRDSLVSSATPGVVTKPGTGSPNRLLFVG
ncbi:MAG TPA: S8 family peptidase [Actinoplanes sp.]|nr:S8 family peptidase [Actinoplanes sp.]